MAANGNSEFQESDFKRFWVLFIPAEVISFSFSENWVPDIKVWQAKLGYPKLDASSEKLIVSDYLIGEVWDRAKTRI